MNDNDDGGLPEPSGRTEPGGRKASGVRGMLSRLKHPWLFGLAAVAFVADLFIPDVVPFVDEIVLAAVATALGLWRDRKPVQPDDGD